MRKFVAVLLLIGSLAVVVFYAGRGSPTVPTIGPTIGSSKGSVTEVADRGSSNRDGGADLDAEFGAGDDPSTKPVVPNSNPSTAPPQRPKDVGGKSISTTFSRGSSDGNEHATPDHDKTIEQVEILRQALAASLRREQSEAEQAGGNLTAARRNAETAVKDRGDLLSRSARAEAENSKLRSSLQSATTELVAQQHRLVEQTSIDEKAEQSRQAVLLSQNVASQTRAEAAAARTAEVETRLGKAETTIKTLNGKLDDLGATAQRTTSRLRDELVATGAAARTQADSLAKVSKELQKAQDVVKTLVANRVQSSARLASLTARQALAFAGLTAARGSLSLANAHLEATQRLADLASEKSEALSKHDDALGAQAADAAVRASELQKAVDRGVASYTALESRARAAVVQQNRANADISAARAENAKLSITIKDAALVSAQQLAALGSRTTSLTSEAARIPDLNHKIDTLKTKVDNEEKAHGDSERAYRALEEEDGRHLAEIDKLRIQMKENEAKSTQAKGDPTTQVNEATRAKELQAALGTAQLRLAQDGRDRIAVDQARLASDKHASDIEAELQAERQQSAVLASKAKDAERGVTQAVESTRQLQDAKDKAKRLDAALASAQEQLAQAKRETIAANDARRSSERATSDINAKLQTERTQTALLTSKVAEADRDAAQASLTSKRLEIGRDRARDLNAALASAQTQLVQAQRGTSAANDARRSSEKATSDIDAKLQAERRQTIVLTSRMAKADRDATEASALAERLASEKIKATQLESALVSARMQLAQAKLDKPSVKEARRSSETTAANDATTPPAPVTPLDIGTDNAGRDVVQSANRKRPATQREEVARTLEPPNSPIGAQPAPSAGDPSGSRTVSAAPTAQSTTGVSREVGLPTGILARVILRYAHDREPAQAHANALKTLLQSLGMDVTDTAGSSGHKPGNQVTYFYKEDSSAANRVARQLETSAPVLSRNSGERFARPGTIEVTVGG